MWTNHFCHPKFTSQPTSPISVGMEEDESLGSTIYTRRKNLNRGSRRFKKHPNKFAEYMDTSTIISMATLPKIVYL